MGLIDYSIKNKKSELVLKNANIVNVFSHEIIKADVAIEKGIIVGIGSYDGINNIDKELFQLVNVILFFKLYMLKESI